MNPRLFTYVGVLILVVLLTGCVFSRQVKKPIPHRNFHVEQSNETLVVLLPGRMDNPGDFLENGTVKQIRKCNPDANIVGVDAHLGYYLRGSVIKQLRQNVIGPALEEDVEHVWILGISLGGMGSLMYRRVHPGDLEGVILMAPYLGEWDSLERYIDERVEYDDPATPRPFRLMWQHISTSMDRGPSVTLAFGNDDRYVRQQKWLAGFLNGGQVIRRSGGHSWSVWKKLWPRAMKTSGLCDRKEPFKKQARLP